MAWKGDSRKHSLARKGIKTKNIQSKGFKRGFSEDNPKEVFASCFDMDKIEPIMPYIPKIQLSLRKRINKSVNFPIVKCMTTKEIIEGRKEGGGHGLYIYPATVKINANMDSINILWNYIHEMLHFIKPDASQKEIRVWTNEIGKEVGL